MTDKAEVPLICGAAGDPCTAEIPKPLSDHAIDNNADTKIAPLPEVINSNVSPLDCKEILPENTAVQEICNANKTPPKANAPSGQPEAPPQRNGSDAENPQLLNLREEVEVQKRTAERDNYEKKLADTENKLTALEAAYEAAISGKDDQSNLRRELKELKNSLAQSQAKFNDRGRLIANQENQINALGKQVSSLKEVVAITKNLLEIRNMEVKHLQEDVDSMENRITAERERHNAMLRKMEAAVRLNADLKTEYETQLRLFQDLRGKYEEKVTLLTGEDKTVNGTAAILENNSTSSPPAQ
ncbi:uncharacterized protein [Venturia canescens]|uniref:uncharacterized protein isoform X2 n=1 Tax=Venturia canescens TaxID=32260 RepID=UPI001C9BFBC9|nr:uncharacterized protein LOC122409915 isoform X2 [Venturia canescens]